MEVKPKKEKKKKYVRTAAGETWEDPSLQEWDPGKFIFLVPSSCQLYLILLFELVEYDELGMQMKQACRSITMKCNHPELCCNSEQQADSQ